MREKLDDLINKYDEEGNLECHSAIRELLHKNGIDQCEVSVVIMLHNLYSISVAWIENGKLELFNVKLEVVISET